MSIPIPSSYEFVPLPDRAPLNSRAAPVAPIFTINIEYWEPFRPGQKEPVRPPSRTRFPAMSSTRRTGPGANMANASASGVRPWPNSDVGSRQHS
jgi:hypothetical protein